MSVDTWDDGAGYEPYVGRWSRLVAADFIRWLDIPADSAWLDFGCGTGALSQTILAHAAPRLVVGCDRSSGYVDFARRNTRDGRAQFVVAQLPDLPRAADGFDACVTGLVLNFLPSPDMAVATMSSRVRRGGTVAAYVWDYSAGMDLMRVFWDAAVAQDPSARALDEGSRFPLCHAEPLGTLFERAGLDDVAVRPVDVPTVFRDFDDYWSPFLGGQGPAPGYAMSLSADRREQLRDTIRRRLSTDRDGQIRLTARAWAVRGVVGSTAKDDLGA
jgi:SAM-dependent methyltransferase